MRKITVTGFLLALGLISLPALSQEKPQGRKAFGKTISRINPANGLVRCVSSEYEASLQDQFPDRANNAAFETWLAPKIAEAKAQRAAAGHNSPAVVINIPVVVHVIHNGDAVGVGENIADARVISQITVLNQDFRRMTGTPGFNSNPAGADVEIQFCLAQTNPDGGPTTGINRVNLGVAQWATSAQVEGTLKPSTQWDPTRYFNIWVCQFSNNMSSELYGVLGYAQFPSNSNLPGLNVNGGNANTDGVIIDYRCFGSKTLANVGTYMADYDKGRTATHEIGHCFGLRHIWGDSDVCSEDDFCNDTPQAATEHYGCETGSNTCASAGNDMVENYMDYSDDSCMNIFTQNQKERMLAVMQFSPRRASLATSTACNVAQVYQNDGSLNMSNLNITGCNTNFSPTLQLRNMGTSTMTSAVISYNVDGGASQTYNWNGSLVTNAVADVNLPAVTATPGTHVLNISIASVNGVADPYADNSNKQVSFTIAGQYNTSQVLFTLQRDIYGSETTWTLKNSAGATVYSGGPYTDTTTLPAVMTQTWTVANNECYTFTINDAYGDGICCDYGNGYYLLKTASDITIAAGGGFGASEQAKFGINTSLANPAFEALSQITLYPNPASDVINIAAGTEYPESYSVYNAIGQLVSQRNVAASSDLSIHTANYPSGIYFIKLSKDGETRTLQFIKK